MDMKKALNNVHKVRFLFNKILDPFSCYHRVLIISQDDFVMNGRGFFIKRNQIIPYVNLNLKEVIFDQSSVLPILNKFIYQATKVVDFDLKDAKIIKEKIFDKILSYYYVEIDNLPITLLKTCIDFFNVLFDDKNFEKKLFLKESIFKDRKHVHYCYVIFDNKNIIGACQDSVSFVLS